MRGLSEICTNRLVIIAKYKALRPI